MFVRSDVSSEAEVKTLIEKTVEQYGRLDCAFNNAGINPPQKPLHEQLVEDFDKLGSALAEIKKPTKDKKKL